ncbi:MAG: tetratricopeptide repeat protein [Pseudolabrys sp.]
MTLLQTAKTLSIPQSIQTALDFHRQGKLPQAEKLYSDVLAVRPDYFEALHMLGLIKQQRGDLSGALRLMSAALQTRPKSPEVLLNYSIVLNSLGRDEEALAALDLVLSLKRRWVEAHNNRGAVLEKLGRDLEALEAFDRALEIKGGHVDALYNRGSVLRKLGRHEEALKDFDRVLTIKPNHFRAHNNRGIALDGLDRPEEALASYDRALSFAPNFVEALNNRGNVLQKCGRHEDAVACYDRALAINPEFAEVHNNRGRSLAFLGRQQEALANTSRAVAIRPDYVDAQWNEALLLLRLGNFSRGWQQYEWRWKRGEGIKKLRTYPQPLWLGDAPIEGKTVFVHHEQGFGDTIQFARYATLLKQRGARVVLEVQPPLKSLISQIDAGIQVIASGDEVPEFDLHCPLVSLPLAFRTELATIPADIPYLSIPGERVAHWKDRMPPRQGFRVGVVWSGNPTHKDDHNRSISLDRLSPLFDSPNVTFISLQKELRERDARILEADPRLADVGRHFGDFTDTAAAVALVDLVISVDTSVAHLAGALDKPVWVLLPLCPDWRWLTDRDDSPWYPSARLFRQPAIGDWESVVEQVRGALAQHAGG